MCLRCWKTILHGLTHTDLQVHSIHVDGELSLRSMMPVHEVKTVELSYGDEEATESQWVHMAHARFGKPFADQYGS